ncbi:MAG TPA: GNAT family N-acetyltransferase [Candidatus Limnocylindrales bacterium]
MTAEAGRGAAVRVRPAEPPDFAALGDLTVAAYRALADAPDEPDYFAELRDVATRAALAVVLVAIDARGALLGGATYVPGPENPYSELLGEGDAGIRMLAVDPASQGRGVGAALVRAVIERARAEGRRRIVLHTTPWMLAAHRLYARLGFVRAPELDWLPLPEVPLLGYVLPLDPAAGP